MKHIVLALFWALLPVAASAEASLQLTPLKYEDNLNQSAVSRGYVEVANPTDSAVTVTTHVKGFRQVDLDGNLQYFDQPQYAAGIIPDLPSFDLGPREAIRVAFSVDPNRLPRGEIFAVLFFQTQAVPASSKATYLLESANIGTLLLLHNGPVAVAKGEISQFSLPFIQLGNAVLGSARVTNTGTTADASAITPEMGIQITSFGHVARFKGPLILPGSSRTVILQRNGSFFGLMPVSLSIFPGVKKTSWVLACTGIYSYLLLIAVLLAVTFIAARLLRRFKSKLKRY